MMTEQHMHLNIEGLEQFQSKLENSSSEWLKAFRQKAFNQLTEIAMPTVKDEEWKYTSLAEVVNHAVFQIASHHRLAENKQFENYRDKADINIVLVNGVLWGELSDLKHLPQGLTDYDIE